MREPFLRDTRLAGSRLTAGLGGRVMKVLEFPWTGEGLRPGQFIMAAGSGTSAAGSGAAMNWPHPLQVQAHTENGLLAFAMPEHPLFGLQAGDAVTLWGPCGRGLPEADCVLLCDEAGWPLVTPFLLAGDGRVKAVCLYTAHSEPAAAELLGRAVALTPVADLTDPGTLAGLYAAGTLVAALPLAAVAALKPALSAARLAATRLFAGVKVGCGVGACRGCHIHHPDFPHGMPVCQEGPFVPMDKFDFARDQNFLTHYMSGGMV